MSERKWRCIVLHRRTQAAAIRTDGQHLIWRALSGHRHASSSDLRRYRGDRLGAACKGAAWPTRS